MSMGEVEELREILDKTHPWEELNRKRFVEVASNVLSILRSLAPKVSDPALAARIGTIVATLQQNVEFEKDKLRKIQELGLDPDTAPGVAPLYRMLERKVSDLLKSLEQGRPTPAPKPPEKKEAVGEPSPCPEMRRVEELLLEALKTLKKIEAKIELRK